MKKSLIFFSLLTLLIGCDAPQRTRAPQSWVNSGSLQDPGNQSGTFNPSPSTGNQTGSTGSGVNDGWQNCDLSNKYQTIDIGWFGLCQSTQDESLIRFKPSLTSSSTRVCLIPTYKAADNSSTYLGQPQCTYTTAGTVVTGKLYKDRAGFSDRPINGVIVMKEPLLPEYFNCMQGYLNWPANVCPYGPSSNNNCAYAFTQCPAGARTSAFCASEATNYMNQICTRFKSTYSNSYLDIRLK